MRLRYLDKRWFFMFVKKPNRLCCRRRSGFLELFFFFLNLLFCERLNLLTSVFASSLFLIQIMESFSFSGEVISNDTNVTVLSEVVILSFIVNLISCFGII